MSNQLWLLSVPKGTSGRFNVDSIISTLRSQEATVKEIQVPAFMVGTLDSLVTLSDDLNKVSTAVENVARKIERQYLDMSQDGEKLRVNGLEVERYLNEFQWNTSQFPFQFKTLADISASVQSLSTRVDEDLKKLTSAFTDKSQNMAALQRRKTVNMATSDIEDFLKPELAATVFSSELRDSEYFAQFLVVVPRALAPAFEKEYQDIGSNIAVVRANWDGKSESVGKNNGKFGANAAATRTMSPVVPGSLKVVLDDEKMDSKLYCITSLKGHYTAGGVMTNADNVASFVEGTFTDYSKPLKEAFREKKYTLRDATYNASAAAAGGLDSLLTQAKKEFDEVQETLVRWCGVNFGQVYSAWIHLRIIKAFAESVLRYGLPVNASLLIVKPLGRAEKQTRESLTKTILDLIPELKVKKGLFEEEEDEDFDNLPYVCQKFAAIGL